MTDVEVYLLQQIGLFSLHIHFFSPNQQVLHLVKHCQTTAPDATCHTSAGRSEDVGPQWSWLQKCAIELKVEKCDVGTFAAFAGIITCGRWMEDISERFM